MRREEKYKDGKGGRMKRDVYKKRVPVQRHMGTYIHFKSENSR